MSATTRLALAVALAFATVGGAAAQTSGLTVNKVQQTMSGQALTSNTVVIGVPMMYVVTVSSSNPTASSAVTITDTLPGAGFVLLTATCGATAPASCNGPTNIPFTGNPATLTVSATIPAAAGNGIAITMTGYFTNTGTFNNHVQALRSGETTPDMTEFADTSLVINPTSLPTGLVTSKTVTFTPPSTIGGTLGTGTVYTYKVTVQNNSPSAVYLGGFQMTDFLLYNSGTIFPDFQLSNFACTDPACPIVPSVPTTGSVTSSSPAFSSPAFSLTWGSSSVLPGNGASFSLTFDATFYGATCGPGSSGIENDVSIRTLGSSPTNVTNVAKAFFTASFLSTLPACPPPLPGLALSKVQMSPANPVAWGSPVMYQISFTNTTTAPLLNLAVQDFLAVPNSSPIFQAMIASAPTCVGSACTFGPTSFPTTIPISGSPTLFTAYFASVPAGQAVTITFTVTYQPPQCSTVAGMMPITNYAEAETSASGFTSVVTKMQPLPLCMLTVTKTLTKGNPVVLGQPVAFQITYTNNNLAPVTVRTLEDVLSVTTAGAAYGSLPIQITAASCQATGSVSPLPTPVAAGTNTAVTFNNPYWSGLKLLDIYPTAVTFGPGASLSCALQFVPQQPTSCQGTGNPQLYNSAFIDNAVVDTSSTAQPTVFAFATADLPLCRSISIKKSAPTMQSFTPGQTVTYTVQVTNNNSNYPVTGVQVTDPLPAGFAYVSSTCAACVPAPTVAGGVLQASIPTIAANASVVITISVTAPATGGSYHNSATAGFVPGGNFFAGAGTVLSSTANVQVLTPRLTKAFSPLGGGPPNQATLTLTLTNVPNNPVEMGITFTDTLNPGIQIVGPPSTTCMVGSATVVGNAITFQGAMQAGEATCTVSVAVAGAGCNQPSNFSNTNNIDPSNASAMLNVTQCPPAGTFDPEIPTLSPWGLASMVLLLAGIGLLRVWRGRRRA